MPRPADKEELLKAGMANYNALIEFIDGMSEVEMNTPFDFSMNNKKEAHWARDKNVRDILVHLYEWHQLTLKCIERSKSTTSVINYLPEGYTWKTYGDMNLMFWQKHQNTSLSDARRMLDDSHSQMMKLVESYTQEELFERGKFNWCGNNAIASYFISNMSSHYDWAIKKLKLHRKNVKGKKNAI